MLPFLVGKTFTKRRGSRKRRGKLYFFSATSPHAGIKEKWKSRINIVHLKDGLQLLSAFSVFCGLKWFEWSIVTPWKRIHRAIIICVGTKHPVQRILFTFTLIPADALSLQWMHWTFGMHKKLPSQTVVHLKDGLYFNPFKPGIKPLLLSSF